MNRRTTLITAAAVAGTVLAGTPAVAANIGILNSAESSPIGDLNATVDLAPAPAAAEPQIVDIYLDDPIPATVVPTTVVDSSSTTSQEFSVDDAGTVTVQQTESGLRLGEVIALPGWEWESTQGSETELVVTFTSGGTTYVFSATVAADGAMAARVDQPIVQTIQVPAPSSASPAAAPAGSAPSATAPPTGGGYHGDDDDHEEHHDDEHEEDEEDEEDEHEGGDDDD